MTTSRSPLRVLKGQADVIAKKLKAVSRGEKVDNDPGGKIAASLARGSVKFGVVMDDKVITVEASRETVKQYSEVALSEFLLRQMRGARETLQ